MDQVEAEVEKRIGQMTDILEFKDATIEELRARLNRAALEASNQDPHQSHENVSMLTQAIRDREEQIEQLQEKLSEASRYSDLHLLIEHGSFTLLILRDKGSRVL